MRFNNVFIVAAKESYGFISENLDEIIKQYNLTGINITVPYDFNNYKFLNMMIDNNSQDFLIESDEYIRNIKGYHTFSENQIQDLRIVESKRRAYKQWLKQKLNYSRKEIIKSDACLIVLHDELNEITKKELRDELNIAQELKKDFILLDYNKINSRDIKKLTKQKHEN